MMQGSTTLPKPVVGKPMTRTIGVALAAALAIALGACTMDETEQRVTTGALGGAALGAATGGIFGGGKGAAIGAVAGTAVGAGTGYVVDQNKKRSAAPKSAQFILFSQKTGVSCRPFFCLHVTACYLDSDSLKNLKKSESGLSRIMSELLPKLDS